MAIDETQIRAMLARILGSPGFAAAPNLAAFLRYVVEETLAGRADRLKAYSIAVAALDRAETFDPNDNPLVRVQARRLRTALARYYDTDGAEDPVRIDLPVGSYVPQFSPRESDATGARPRPAMIASPRGIVRLAAISAAALVLVVLSGIGGVYWHEHSEMAERRALTEGGLDADVGLDAARVLPLLVIEIEARNRPVEGFDAEGYRRRIEGFAERFDDMVVVSRRSADFPAPNGQPIYRLHFAFATRGGADNAYFQLVHAGDERVVRTGAFRFTPDMNAPYRPGSGATTPRDLDGVRAIVESNGALALDVARLGDLGEQLSCLMLGGLFASDHNAALQRAARSCLESVVAANPRLAPAYALLGEMYLREYAGGLDRLPGDPLARAEAVLRRAVALAPASATPRQSLAEVLLLRGDVDGAVSQGAAAVELNPEDMINIARHGARLARLGRDEEAMRLLTRAEADIDVVPVWIVDHLFLAYDGLGRATDADRIVGDARLSRAALHLAVAAIAARRRGDVAAAATALADLVAGNASFRDDPLTPWRHRGFAPAVADRLVAALRAAGLPAPRG